MRYSYLIAWFGMTELRDREGDDEDPRVRADLSSPQMTMRGPP
jgi:hypothetical protein